MALDASVDLRALVREVLRETMAARAAPAGGVQAVSIACDADLQAFLVRLAAPGTIEAVRSGALRFTLAAGQAGHGLAVPAAPATGAMEGVISERRLQGIAAGSTLTLAAGAVLTPMARDVARRLGLRIERMR
ncbi:hypothetical protein RNZ50_10815 [Paracoccaceae bacterium Fryx2]|nr:hypothetical protein [Paracoccaceae bacterium Fryx2]